MAYGSYSLLKKLWVPTYGFYKHFIRPRRNLNKRYGGKWAVVTGGSDGIGEALCYELASEGFNIVIISRTETKMLSIATRLKYEYKVQAKTY